MPTEEIGFLHALRCDAVGLRVIVQAGSRPWPIAHDFDQSTLAMIQPQHGLRAVVEAVGIDVYGDGLAVIAELELSDGVELFVNHCPHFGAVRTPATAELGAGQRLRRRRRTGPRQGDQCQAEHVGWESWVPSSSGHDLTFLVGSTFQTITISSRTEAPGSATRARCTATVFSP